MGEDDLSEAARRKQFRLVGLGIGFSGATTLLVAYLSTNPHGILVVGLGFVAVAMLVFERTQGAPVAVSLGLLTGTIGVWLWPHLEPEGSYYLAGVLLLAAGVLNVFLAPALTYFKRFGERLAER